MADRGQHGISWTDATWNPVVGCSIVSPACTNCYAMSMAARIERMSGGKTHYAGTTKVVNGKPVWTGKLALAPDHILTAPLRWRRPRRVFVNSMSDLFHEDMPEEWIDRVFAIMVLSPQHTFQILTKWPERMRVYLSHQLRQKHIAHKVGKMVDARGFDGDVASDAILDGPWPPPNVWLGVTAEDQVRADERIPHLLATPAAVRFVSAEPLLRSINFRRISYGISDGWLAGYPAVTRIEVTINSLTGAPKTGIPGLDWVIVGGESGPGARPTHPDWVRSIRDQCAAAGVAFHFKQWGEWAPCPDASDWPYDKDYDRTTWMGEPSCIRPIEPGWSDKYHCGGGAQDPFKLQPYGGSLFGTPEYLDQVARCPQPKCGAAGRCLGNDRRKAMRHIGKHRAGRSLDGVIHDAFPEVRRG